MKSKVGFLIILLVFLCTLLTKAQSVKINNNFEIEADGTPKLNGEATVYDDMMVYPDATTKNGSYQPTYTLFVKNTDTQGVFLWAFSSSTEQELYFTVQIPHKYKQYSALQPHVHWTTLSETPTRSNVVWGLEYNVVKIGGTFNSTNEVITASSVISNITSITGDKQHLISSFTDIPGTNLEISTVIMCRLFRKVSDSKDTFANPVFLLGFDFHYEIDTEGSRTPFTK